MNTKPRRPKADGAPSSHTTLTSNDARTLITNDGQQSGDPVLSFVAILAPLFSGATVFYYHPHLNTTWKTAPAVPNPRPDDSGRYKAGLDSDPGMAR